MTLLSIEDISFSYASEPLFEKFSFSLDSPQFLGILGLNGTGKSTLMRLLLHKLHPQRGRISLLGHSAGSRALRLLVGSALQEIDFPESIRVQELLGFVRAHHKRSMKQEELIDRFQLRDFCDKRCGELSGGMKRRVAMACAFAGYPKVVLLDEPSTGIDKQGRKALMETIHRYQQEEQALILMITHHPEEVAESVDQFLLLTQGENPRLIDPHHFQEMASLKSLTFFCKENLNFQEVRDVQQVGDLYTVVGRDSDALVRSLTAQTKEFHNLAIQSMSVDQILERYL